MKNKNIFTRKEIENLFEELIEDLKKSCYMNKTKGFYIGKKKVGIIRYFLSLRLDYLIKLKKKK